MMGDAAWHMPITPECLSSEGSDAHGHACSHTQQYVIVFMYRLGGIYMHRRIFNLSKSKQMSWLSVQLSGISKRYMAMPYIVFSLLYPYVLRNYLKKSGVLL